MFLISVIAQSGIDVTNNVYHNLDINNCITESEQQRYGLKICENELLLLGVFIGKNQSQCNELNWRGKINKIKALLNMWLQRTLTIQGRVTGIQYKYLFSNDIYTISSRNFIFNIL
jgi:hypothetical protein